MAQYGGKQNTLYHYTTSENAEEIARDRTIKASPTGYYGPDKVYLTETTPDRSTEAILKNNYDNSPAVRHERADQGHADAAIKISMDDDALTKEPASTNRNVWSHKGPLHLDTVDSFEVVNRKK